MRNNPFILGAGSGHDGLAIGVVLSLMQAAAGGRARNPEPPTPAQIAAKAKRDELAEWNAAIEERKAEKRARKQTRDA